MGKPGGKSDVGNSKSSEDSVQSAARQPIEIMSSVVKQSSKKVFGASPCRNLILTSEPRLYLTTSLGFDKVEGVYKKDILLYVQLQVKQKKRDEFEIHCPFSKKTYGFQTDDAEKWV